MVSPASQEASDCPPGALSVTFESAVLDKLKCSNDQCSMFSRHIKALQNTVTPEGKGPFGRPSPMWEYNIKIYIREGGQGAMHWIHLAQDIDHWRALVNTVLNHWVP
jgi:hypothetical protein